MVPSLPPVTPLVSANGVEKGTALVYVCMVRGLYTYHAVPDNSGILKFIGVVDTDAVNKFHTAALHNGRIFLGNGIGQFMAFGKP